MILLILPQPNLTFELTTGENKGIIVDTRDVLSGDMERADVATAIAKLLVTDLVTNKVMFSIINKPGKSPNDQGKYQMSSFSWMNYLSQCSFFFLIYCHSLVQYFCLVKIGENFSVYLPYPKKS